MTHIANVVSGILAASDANVILPEERFLADDGLLHCKKCGKPVQCRITIFGEEQIVHCICDCIKAKLDAEEERKRMEDTERRRRDCFEGSDMITWTFEKDDHKDEGTLKAARNYTDSFEEFLQSGQGLMFYGGNGTGKTFAACCIANALVDKGYKCLVTTFVELANRMQGLREGKQDFIESLDRYHLLVLDDLGAERQSDYMQEQVFNVVNARCCSKLPFIVTTNLSVEEITKPQDYGRARIYSRVLGCCFPLQVNKIERRKATLKENFPGMASKLGL